jgi:class III poly(R)-hydroxyalkanoic acid synthase PhaE subunit
MKDKKYNPFKDFDWLEAQRQYLNAWESFGLGSNDKGSSSSTDPIDVPWVQAIDFWWKSVESAAPSESRDFFGKVVEQTRAFYLVSTQLTQFIQAVSDINKATENWQDKLAEQFQYLKAFFTKQQDPSEALNGIMGAWHLMPMDTLQRTLSSSSFLPGDFLKEFKPEGVQSVTDKFLSVPGVGYTRESQEQIRDGIKLWSEFQKTLLEYNNEICGVTVNALDSMHKKILSMAEEGKEVNTLREIYDLWVDCNEDAFADYVFTKEHSELYGRLINALMACKKHGRNIVDEALASMNMPTRKGLDTINKRQQELRRELVTTKVKMEQGDKRIQKLGSQVAAMKNELELLKSVDGKSAEKEMNRISSNNISRNKRASRKKSASKKTTASKVARKKITSKKAAKKKGARKKSPVSKVTRSKKPSKKAARKKTSGKSKKDNMIVIKI